MSIYVEIQIRGKMDDLWRLTQTPDQHVAWDLRFTDIEYLPRPDITQPQQFLYSTRLGFGLAIAGKGETVGEREKSDTDRASALKFWSDDSKSLIREGTGYWRYIATNDDLRFITSYDYHVRFGVFGRAFDALVFRPLIGWATAWSFDRLRLWIEKGIDPAVSMERSLIHLIARVSLAFVWLFQGLVPKLMHQHADELIMIKQSGIPESLAPSLLTALGFAEVTFGLGMLLLFHHRWPFVLTIVLMIGATLNAVIHSPEFLVGAFNATSLNVLMIALALVGLAASKNLPSAARCLRKQPADRL
jgi:hypothetical protein